MIQRLLSLFRKNFGVASLFLILIGSLALNVILGVRFVDGRGARPAAVRVGSKLSSVPITNGPAADIRLNAEQSYILYVMSPRCPWCARNLNNIRSVASRNQKYQLVGISISRGAVAEHVKANLLPFPVYELDLARAPSELAQSGTPTTVVIKQGGVVEKVWSGAYTGLLQPEVEKFFGITLPGLLADAPVAGPPVASSEEGSH